MFVRKFDLIFLIKVMKGIFHQTGWRISRIEKYQSCPGAEAGGASRGPGPLIIYIYIYIYIYIG
jgi:hypothetical protein